MTTTWTTLSTTGTTPRTTGTTPRTTGTTQRTTGTTPSTTGTTPRMIGVTPRTTTTTMTTTTTTTTTGMVSAWSVRNSTALRIPVSTDVPVSNATTDAPIWRPASLLSRRVIWTWTTPGTAT